MPRSRLLSQFDEVKMMLRRGMVFLLALSLGLMGLGPVEALTPGQRAALFGGLPSKLNPANTVGYTYYVNSVTGSNSNSGRSFSSPLADVTSLPALTAGQSVCLEGGSSWRQQLTVSANGVTIGGCGPGAKPVLDASDVLLNANFVLTGGESSTYQTTAAVTFTLAGGAAWINVFETGGPTDNANGQFLSNQSSIANVEANPCSYFIPGLTTSSVPASALIYVHACDGRASGSIVFPANPANGDTVTLNGVAWTFVTAAPSGNQVQIRANLQMTLDALVSTLLGSANASLTVATYGDTLVANALTVLYKTDGAGGNAYTLAASSATPSGATLTGGQVASSPITNGYTYEVTQRSGVVMGTGAGNGKIYNVECRKPADNNGCFDLGANGGAFQLSGVIARDGGKHNLLLAGGSKISNSTIIDGYVPGGSGNTELVFFDGGSGLPISVDSSIFQQDQLVGTNNATTAIISHTSAGSLGAASITNSWFISKNGANFALDALGNVPSESLANDYGSQLTIGLSPQPLVYSAQNIQLVSDYDNTSNTPINFGFANVVATFSNSKFCTSNGFFGTIRIQQAVSLTLSNVLGYVRAPFGSFPAIVYNTSIGSTFTYGGADFGGERSGWKPLDDVGSGNAFASGSSANNYDPTTVSPQWVINNGGIIGTLANWKAAVSPQDASATSNVGNSLNACTLPAIPVVN